MMVVLSGWNATQDKTHMGILPVNKNKTNLAIPIMRVSTLVELRKTYLCLLPMRGPVRLFVDPAIYFP